MLIRVSWTRVQFTEAGRSALTDALMAEQAGPPVQHRSLWMKRGMAAVLAAVLLVGTAAAVTASLWDSFFGRLDPGEQAVVDTLSGGLPGAVSAGGAMMTPMAPRHGWGILPDAGDFRPQRARSCHPWTVKMKPTSSSAMIF